MIVRNFGITPRAVLEPRSGGAAVDVGPDLRGIDVLLPHVSTLLKVELAASSFREHLFFRYQQMPTKMPTIRPAGRG